MSEGLHAIGGVTFLDDLNYLISFLAYLTALLHYLSVTIFLESENGRK